jgi:hypothetical protein
MRAAPTLDRTTIGDIMQEVERAGQQYERGFTETGKQPPGSFGGLGDLARGWRSLADGPPARDAEFSTFVDKATPALRKSENRANFVPGPLAGTPPVDKHAEDFASIRGKLGVPSRVASALSVRSGLLSSCPASSPYSRPIEQRPRRPAHGTRCIRPASCSANRCISCTSDLWCEDRCLSSACRDHCYKSCLSNTDWLRRADLLAHAGARRSEQEPLRAGVNR